MKSILVLSVVLVAMIAPVLTARDSNPRRGMVRLIVILVLYNAAYLVYITLIHPYVFVPHWP